MSEDTMSVQIEEATRRIIDYLTPVVKEAVRRELGPQIQASQPPASMTVAAPKRELNQPIVRGVAQLVPAQATYVELTGTIIDTPSQESLAGATAGLRVLGFQVGERRNLLLDFAGPADKFQEAFGLPVARFPQGPDWVGDKNTLRLPEVLRGVVHKVNLVSMGGPIVPGPAGGTEGLAVSDAQLYEAVAEGRRAFGRGASEASNPYTHLRKELSLAWAQGWKEERAESEPPGGWGQP